MDSTVIKSEINRLRKDYFFRLNEQATCALSGQIGFRVGRQAVCGDNFFVLQASETEKVIKFDSSFNLVEEYSLKELSPVCVFSLIPYKDGFIAVDGKSWRILILDENLKKVSLLSDQVPELKGKLIVCAEPDDKGGIYFSEKSSGNVFYLDANSEISCFSTDARLPYSMTYCNDTLYIADMFLTHVVREFNNIYYLKDGKSERTQLTGGSLVYSEETDSVFIADYNLSNSITKYTTQLDKVFIKLFDPKEKSFPPFIIQSFKNHIICIDYSTFKPVVYDICD